MRYRKLYRIVLVRLGKLEFTDPRIKSPLLYRLSYKRILVLMVGFEPTRITHWNLNPAWLPLHHMSIHKVALRSANRTFLRNSYFALRCATQT